jgi:hypothetical protein
MGVGGIGVGWLGAAATSGNLTPAQIYQTALGAGFPPSVAVQMTAISLRETGGTGNPNAYYGGTAANPEASYGLWQINYNDPNVRSLLNSIGITDPSQLYDPATNAAAAYALYGGNPNNLNVAWYINKGGAYTAGYNQYLPTAEAAAASVDGTTVDSSTLNPNTGTATIPVTDGAGSPTAASSSSLADSLNGTDNTTLYIMAAVVGLVGLMVATR